MSCDEVVAIAKKALRILGDTEHSHLWDCQVDGHAFIALDIAELLRKAKTDEDLKKVLKKINKNDFDCETDSHFEMMSEISELLACALAEEKEESAVTDTTIKHFIVCGSDKNPEVRSTSPTIKGKSRKCCKFCIKISRSFIVHSHCCKGTPHAHFSGLKIDNSRGPTRLSKADSLENRNAYGQQFPIDTVITARYLVKKLNISQTV